MFTGNALGGAPMTGQPRPAQVSNLHEVGERVVVPTFALRQSLAWWVGAELVRRHPETLRLIEVHPHHYGPALTLWEERRDAPPGGGLAFLTLGAHFHITPFGGSPNGDLSFNWLEVLLAPNRRHDIVERLETHLGMAPPPSTPSTVATSIGPRMIAAFLQRTALERDLWVMSSGAYQDEDDSATNEALLRQQPEVAADLDNHDPARHPFGLVASRYWFLSPLHNGEAGPPIRAIDTTAGIAWVDGVKVSLMDEFRAGGRSLDHLVSSVMPAAQ